MNQVVRLAQSFGEWRAAARELIALGVAPVHIAWQSQPGEGATAPAACVRDGNDCATHDATWPEVAKTCWAVSPPPRKRGAS